MTGAQNPLDRLDIPWMWMADGPHGFRRALATNKAGYGNLLPATCFPTASALLLNFMYQRIRGI